MGGRRPEGHNTGTRNTRMGETNRRQRKSEAPFEGDQGAEWSVASAASRMDGWMDGILAILNDDTPSAVAL